MSQEEGDNSVKRIIRITESQLDGLIKRAILTEIRTSDKTIQEDAVLLRTMTEKSVIHFGQHKGQTIEEILRLGKKAYLRYLYYNVEGISFTEDILRKIGIVTDAYDDRISKPGKDPEYGKEVEEHMFKHAGIITKNRVKSRAKAKGVASKIKDAKQFSRGNLAWKNQGH